MIRPRSKRTGGRVWVTPRRDGPRSCSSQAASLPRSSASAVRNTTVPPGSRAAVFARDRQRAAFAIPVYRSAGAIPALAQASVISCGVRAGGDLGVRIVPGIDGDALPCAPVDAEHRVPHDLPVGRPEQLPGPVLQANRGGPGAEEPDPAGVHHADPDAVVDLPLLTGLRERLLGPNPGQPVVRPGPRGRSRA